MRIAVLGGGPGGLLAALLAKRGDPAREVTVFERNRAGDTFGFGVVFSDARHGQVHLVRHHVPVRRADLRARAGPARIRGDLEAAGVAKFKWPERLEIMAELPVTKMGKLDYKALRDMLAGRSTA